MSPHANRPDSQSTASSGGPRSPASVGATPPVDTEPEGPPGPSSPAEAHDVDSLVAAVAARLSTCLRDLTDVMTDEVLRRVPAYATPRHREPETLRSSLRRICGIMLRLFEERRRLQHDEIVALHVIGAQSARRALPAAAVTESARVAIQAAWRRVVAEAEQIGSGPCVVASVGVLSSLLFDFGQDVATALQDGYRTEAEQRTTGQVQAQATFLERVLEGHWQDDVEIRSQAHALGYDLAEYCGLLVVLPAAGQEVPAFRTGVGKLVEQLGTAVEGPLRTSPVAHILVLASVGAPDELTDLLFAATDVVTEERLVVVPTEPVREVHALAAAYRRAYRYLPLAHAVLRGPGIVPVKDLRLHAVLGGIPIQERVEFVREVLGPVLDVPLHKGNELLETLEALYRRKGRVADVAAEMHLHQNSIRYRLNRVEELTGFSLDVPGDRLHLELAMRLRTIAAEDLGRLDGVFAARGPFADRTA